MSLKKKEEKRKGTLIMFPNQKKAPTIYLLFQNWYPRGRSLSPGAFLKKRKRKGTLVMFPKQ
jgi:hypothetical protein